MPRGRKIHEKTDRKNDQKTVSSKNDVFSQFKRFSGLPASIFIDFGSQNGCPDCHFLMIFWDRVFTSIFRDFCRKKEKTRNMKKQLSYCKNHTIARVATIKKTRDEKRKNIRKNIDFQAKIARKSMKKSRKTPRAAKIVKKLLPSVPFLAKNRFLVDFGVPAGIQNRPKTGTKKKSKKRLKNLTATLAVLTGNPP